MTMHEALIGELEQESQATRRLLERVPEDRLSWRPHPKSMSLGQLALHIARLPRAIADLLSPSDFEVADVPLPEAASRRELVDTLEDGVAHATGRLREWGDDGLKQPWRMLKGGEPLMEMPRIAGVRAIMLNHAYHHRGQLTVYLRMLEVPLPATYGSSADDNRFG
jgi:uncharacterized damage-inducible protein DinB